MRILYAAAIRLPTEKAHGAQIMHTCEALARVGATVDLATPGRATDVSESPFAYYGVTENFTLSALSVPDWFTSGRFGFVAATILFAWRVARHTRITHPDVVYSRDKIVLLALTFFSPRTRCVWEVHGHEPTWVVRRFATRFDVVTITAGIKEDLVECGVASKRVTVAPDGVDLAPFARAESRVAARTRLGLPQDKNIVMYIGRLDGWKGMETLLEASRLLPHDTQVVVIGGEDEHVRSLEAVYPQVRFLGYHPYARVADNEAAADVLVLPNTARDVTSMRFTSPLKLFTYMASGKPLVASDLPSLREVLSEQNAFLVTPDDASALASGIQEALQNEVEAGRRAQNAHRDVEQYTWETRATKILQFLNTNHHE